MGHRWIHQEQKRSYDCGVCMQVHQYFRDKGCNHLINFLPFDLWNPVSHHPKEGSEHSNLQPGQMEQEAVESNVQNLRNLHLVMVEDKCYKQLSLLG